MNEFIRFSIVGVFCTAIDAIIYYTIILFAPYQLALITGYLLSLIVNYYLTIYWTFQSKPNKKNAVGVVSAHLFNLFVIRIGLMYFFVNTIGMSERIAYVPTLCISVVINFLLIRFVIKKTNGSVLR